MPKCEIQWVDDQGNPTPDDNEAIQRIRTVDRFQQIGSRSVHFPASRWFFVCAEHSKRLNDPDMHIWECADL